MKLTPFLIALAIALSACSKEAAQPAKIERPALTQIVGTLAGEGSRLYSGEIRARYEVSMGFRVGGKLAERLVDTGAQVKAGQVLARLDSADAGLAAGAAQSQYRLVEADALRYRELHNKGFVSASALEAKEAALQVARAQAGLTHNQTEYTVLRAEHDGVVTAMLVEVGQVIAAGQPVLSLARSGELEAAIEIPEEQFHLRHVGDAAEVMTLDGVTAAGRLRELSPNADAVSRTYAARVSFNAAKAALGMTARVHFNDKASNELLIPLTAVYQQGKQTAVWVVAADRSISLRQVRIEAYRDNGAVIASGLKGGERIVSAGVHRLSPGEKIQLIDELSTNGDAQ